MAEYQGTSIQVLDWGSMNAAQIEYAHQRLRRNVHRGECRANFTWKQNINIWFTDSVNAWTWHILCIGLTAREGIGKNTHMTNLKPEMYPEIDGPECLLRTWFEWYVKYQQFKHRTGHHNRVHPLVMGKPHILHTMHCCNSPTIYITPRNHEKTHT